MEQLDDSSNLDQVFDKDKFIPGQSISFSEVINKPIGPDADSNLPVSELEKASLIDFNKILP